MLRIGSHLLAIVALLCVVSRPRAEDAKPSGCAVGAEVPSFFVREVTGSRPNKAICLVCRYGARPAVLICVRKLDDRVQDLLVRMDRILDAHRGKGLRGFAIFLDAKVQEVQPKLFTLARRKMLSLPLAFPVETGGPRSMELPDKAQVTVLMYRNRRIAQRFVFQSNELSDKQIERLVAATEKLADPAAP